MKLISGWVYNPLKGLFRGKKSDPALSHRIYCDNYQNCELYACGFCVRLNVYGGYCPYGKRSRIKGFTGRSQKFGSWIRDEEIKITAELVEPIKKLKTPPRKLSKVGDYIYLPYSHMDMCKSVFENGRKFVKGGGFDIKTITELINFYHRSIMGGIIRYYQEKEVPLFLTHLKSDFPELFVRLVSKSPRVEAIVDAFSNVGRKAFISSLKDGTVLYDGYGKSYEAKFVLEGGHLTSHNPSLGIFPFEHEGACLKIKFTPNATTEIVLEEQVDDDTVYED